ncbi:MAG: DUF4190 domain-containing protein [Phycisphaerales bacterium]|nr:DUF4190 domain-containing protein [Phycisphaerales bacterium]
MNTPRSSSWSAWSLVALALSVGLCPLVTLAAIPVALLALRDIRRTNRRGRRLAITAIWISVIVTPLTTTFAIWWNANVRVVLIDGPVSLIRAGQSGDIDTFVNSLGGTLPEDLPGAEHFLTALGDRWGDVVSMRLTESAPERTAPAGAWWVGYEAMFERGATPVEALYVLQSESGAFVLGFRSLRIGAEEALVYPPDKAGGP